MSGTNTQSITGITTFTNVTAFNGSQLNVQNGSTLNLVNSTIGGALSSNGSLNWTNGTLASSGQLIVNSTTSVSGFENRGVIAINGTFNNSSTPLVSGGGSRITINPGGILNTGSSLELNGALMVNNGTITGTTNVNFGSLAKGSGVYGPVNVADGGRFSPGNSPGSATTGSTTWNSGGSYLVEMADAIAGAGIGWDEWNINSQLNFNAATNSNAHFTILLSTLDALAANFDNTHDYDWTILHADGGITGFDPSELALDTSGFKNSLGIGQFSLESTPTDLIIHFSNVPEPISVALFAFAGIFAAHRRRFRR